MGRGSPRRGRDRDRNRDRGEEEDEKPKRKKKEPPPGVPDPFEAFLATPESDDGEDYGDANAMGANVRSTRKSPKKEEVPKKANNQQIEDFVLEHFLNPTVEVELKKLDIRDANGVMRAPMTTWINLGGRRLEDPIRNKDSVVLNRIKRCNSYVDSGYRAAAAAYRQALGMQQDDEAPDSQIFEMAAKAKRTDMKKEEEKEDKDSVGVGANTVSTTGVAWGAAKPMICAQPVPTNEPDPFASKAAPPQKADAESDPLGRQAVSAAMQSHLKMVAEMKRKAAAAKEEALKKHPAAQLTVGGAAEAAPSISQAEADALSGQPVAGAPPNIPSTVPFEQRASYVHNTPLHPR